MKRYIGIDAHKESCTVAVMGPTGRRLREERVETNGRALRDLLRSINGERCICLEEGELAEWLYEICRPLSGEVVVTQPPRKRGSKSDKIDAWARADELRRGVVKRLIFKAPGQYGTLREAVRAHLAMQGDLVRAKNRLKGLLRSRGMLRTGNDLYSPELRVRWIEKLPRLHRRRARLLGDELDRVVDVAEEAETWLLEEAKRTPAVKLVATAPGIGWIRAAEIVATVVSPHRFRSSRHFWSFCGLAVVTAASAEWVRDKTGQWVRRQVPMARGLNENRNPLMKCVFKGAALSISRLSEDQPLRQCYDRLLEETKPNLARLTIARRIAATVLAMWKNWEVYDPKKQDRAKNR
jgi:transposase